MARVKTRTWQVILAIGAFVLAVAWMASGHLITGLAAGLLLFAMLVGGLLYRLMGPPER